MSTPFMLRPKRNLFAPYDPNDPTQAQDDQSIYAPGPELGPAGGPPPPAPLTKDISQTTNMNQPEARPSAAEASMFQPNPTGPMPSQASLRGDPMENATRSLYAPAPQDQAAPPDRQGPYSAPLERPEPPQRIPYPKYDPFSLGHANAYAKQAVDAENAHNDHIYQLRLTAYEAEQRRMIEATYARNAGLNAPLESQLAYLARPDTPGTPEAKAWAQDQLSQTRKMNAPTPKEPTAFEIWREQNPHAPVSEWFKIQPAVQSTTIRTDNPREAPAHLLPQDIELNDGTKVPGSFNNQTGQYQDANGKTIPPERLKGAARQGGGTANIFTPDDAKSVAQAIVDGKQPPTVSGLYRNAAPVRAELARQGYDLSRAETDWKAVQKHMATLNGTQQTRLQQAIVTASDSLGVIENLAKQWDGGGFPILNKVQLALAVNGVLGPKAQQIATNLQAQITDVTSELGNVYMGGNSPTDHALALAGKNLSANWTKDQLLSAIQLARTNLAIRKNSIATAGAVGVSPNSPYLPQGQAGGMGGQAPPAAPTPAKGQKFTHVSESGKYGWDGSKWVEIPQPRQ